MKSNFKTFLFLTFLTMNPFMGGLQTLLSTHPPMAERVKRLNAMA